MLRRNPYIGPIDPSRPDWLEEFTVLDEICRWHIGSPPISCRPSVALQLPRVRPAPVALLVTLKSDSSLFDS
jgi:hypothetical protein